MNPAKRLQAYLETLNIPFKRVHCYGSQVMITAWSEGAAKRWAELLSSIADVQSVYASVDENEDQAAKHAANPSLVKRVYTHKVWRVAARVA